MNILVPTDFSECAKSALNAACELAKLNNGKIHLYHSSDLPEEWEDLSVQQKLNDNLNNAIATEVKAKLDKLANHVRDQKIVCEIHYTGGKFLKNINEILDEISIDLIVMGSHGAGGKKEWFLGSNAQKVIRKVHNDVLVIKNDLSSIQFEKVLFASNLSLKDKEMFLDFLEFLKMFPVKELHILVVDTLGFFSQPSILIYEALDDFKKLVTDIKCKTHFISNYSVDSGIRKFTRDNGIELIGISNVSRSPIKRLFQGSNVEILVNHSEVPVLCLDKD